jgi:hypothetical protein
MQRQRIVGKMLSAFQIVSGERERARGSGFRVWFVEGTGPAQRQENGIKGTGGADGYAARSVAHTPWLGRV